MTEGETDCEPPVAVLAVQEAEQEVALAEVQESVEELPDMTEEGVAVSETVGGGGMVTFITAESDPDPPGPVQVIE